MSYTQDSNGRPIHHAPVLRAGATIGAAATTGATSVNALIPVNSAGSVPLRVRLAATAACYAKLGGTASIVSVAAATAGTAYVPADTITLTGGTALTQAILTVATTKVVSATVGTAGSGGTDGAGVIVQGTTGTGTKFRASVTVTAGVVASVQSVTVAGSYTANPTDITQEPVTLITGGAGLTGAKLAVVMGVATATVTTAGDYSVKPADAVAQGASSGGGTGATFNATWSGTGCVAAAGDILVQPGDPVVLESTGYTNFAGIQVTTGGKLVCTPIES